MISPWWLPKEVYSFICSYKWCSVHQRFQWLYLVSLSTLCHISSWDILGDSVISFYQEYISIYWRTIKSPSPLPKMVCLPCRVGELPQSLLKLNQLLHAGKPYLSQLLLSFTAINSFKHNCTISKGLSAAKVCTGHYLLKVVSISPLSCCKTMSASLIKPSTMEFQIHVSIH